MILILFLLWPLLGEPLPQSGKPGTLSGPLTVKIVIGQTELCRWDEGTAHYRRGSQLKGRSCKGVYRFLTTHSGTMPYWEFCWVADPCMAPAQIRLKPQKCLMHGTDIVCADNRMGPAHCTGDTCW